MAVLQGAFYGCIIGAVLGTMAAGSPVGLVAAAFGLVAGGGYGGLVLMVRREEARQRLSPQQWLSTLE